jgi:hypothetical protein
MGEFFRCVVIGNQLRFAGAGADCQFIAMSDDDLTGKTEESARSA